MYFYLTMRYVLNWNIKNEFFVPTIFAPLHVFDYRAKISYIMSQSRTLINVYPEKFDSFRPIRRSQIRNRRSLNFYLLMQTKRISDFKIGSSAN